MNVKLMSLRPGATRSYPLAAELPGLDNAGHDGFGLGTA